MTRTWLFVSLSILSQPIQAGELSTVCQLVLNDSATCGAIEAERGVTTGRTDDVERGVRAIAALERSLAGARKSYHGTRGILASLIEEIRAAKAIQAWGDAFQLQTRYDLLSADAASYLEQMTLLEAQVAAAVARHQVEQQVLAEAQQQAAAQALVQAVAGGQDDITALAVGLALSGGE